MNQSNDLWIEKYRPKKLTDYFIEEEHLDKIKTWLTNYNNNIEEVPPFIILVGKPGIGKTTLAHLIYQEFNYEIIELNASDIRNKKQIKDTFAKYSKFKIDFSGEKKRMGIIMDELDGISSSNDKGGLTELIDVVNSYKKLQIKIKKERAKENGEDFDTTNCIINYKNPIICTCNVLKTSKFSSLIKKSIVIKLNKALRNNGIKFITKISKAENISITIDEKEQLFKKSFGDYRQILYLLYEHKLNYQVKELINQNYLKNGENDKSVNKSDTEGSDDTTNAHTQIDKTKKRSNKFKIDTDNNSKIDINDTQKLLSSLNINDSNIQKISFCITNQQIDSIHIQNILETDMYQYLLNLYSNYINLFKTLRLSRFDINKFNTDKVVRLIKYNDIILDNKTIVFKDKYNSTEIKDLVQKYNEMNLNLLDVTKISKLFTEGDIMYRFININQQWEIADYLSYINLFFPIYLYRELFNFKNNKPTLYLNYHNDFNYLRQELSAIQKHIMFNFIENQQNIYKLTLRSSKNSNQQQKESNKSKERIKHEEIPINKYQNLDTYNLYYLKRIYGKNKSNSISKDKNLKSMFRIIDKIDKLINL
jgi:hypothetical protein